MGRAVDEVATGPSQGSLARTSVSSGTRYTSLYSGQPIQLAPAAGYTRIQGKNTALSEPKSISKISDGRGVAPRHSQMAAHSTGAIERDGKSLRASGVSNSLEASSSPPAIGQGLTASDRGETIAVLNQDSSAGNHVGFRHAKDVADTAHGSNASSRGPGTGDRDATLVVRGTTACAILQGLVQLSSCQSAHVQATTITQDDTDRVGMTGEVGGLTHDAESLPRPAKEGLTRQLGLKVLGY